MTARLTPEYVRFALVLAPFADAAPVAQNVFRYGSGRALRTPIRLRDRWHLRRRGIRPHTISGDLGRPILEPIGAAITVLIDVVPNATLPRGVSVLMTDTDVVQFEAERETRSREGYSMTVFRAGRVIRDISAERGWSSSRWTWKEAGRPMEWEVPSHYRARHISRRLTRPILFDYAATLGFDAAAWYAGDHASIQQETRLRH